MIVTIEVFKKYYSQFFSPMDRHGMRQKLQLQ